MARPWTDAAREGAGIVVLDVEVVPGADRTEFPSGFNAWRVRLQARIREPPEGGRANGELRRAIAEFFAVPVTQVAIRVGANSRQKRIQVSGLPPAVARAKLEARLGGR